VIKVELHTHTADDPLDRVPHSGRELVVRAAALEYGALAITLHDAMFDPAPLAVFARDHGVTLIPGVERTIAGKHVLLLNFPAGALTVRSFEDVEGLKTQYPSGLVVAPHPFYPIGSALGRARLEAHRPLWDAVEVNAMFVRGADWNRQARTWAKAHGLPLVGNADVHRLSQLGTTWSEVDVPAGSDPDLICAAIRAGDVRVVATPLSYVRAATIFAQMTVGGIRGRLGV
jgi:predicted metal-dependent phosphoesterase TrpH